MDAALPADEQDELPSVLEQHALGGLQTHALPYSTWMRIASRPRASTTCTEQAMHGSKEWMVRKISTGLLGSATGVPISASSHGPRTPLASRGEPFHVLATTHW